MGSGFSEEAPGGENEKIVKKWLIDCGLCGESDVELLQSKGIIEVLLDSVIKKKMLKGRLAHQQMPILEVWSMFLFTGRRDIPANL